MRFDASQHQRMGQIQKLTPSMIQHMQVLQLPLAELEATLEEQFESNFMLEQVEPEAPAEKLIEKAKAVSSQIKFI